SSIPGVRVYSGNKLGHAAFQLTDRAPAKTGVLRDVEGLQMRFRISRKYLQPFLASPKDERTGEFVLSTKWVLTAPASLPSGTLRDYLNHCRSLGVHDGPS